MLTAGRSLDRVRKPAEALKGAGVEIFAIGIGRVGRTGLLRVTTDRKHVFVVGVTRLLSIVRTLKDRICYSPGKLTLKWLWFLPFDLVLLVNVIYSKQKIRKLNLGSVKMTAKDDAIYF